MLIVGHGLLIVLFHVSGKLFRQVGAEGGEELVGNAWATHILVEGLTAHACLLATQLGIVGEVVAQGGLSDVAQVFLHQLLEQSHGSRLLFLGQRGQEVAYGSVVAAGGHKQRGQRVGIVAMSRSPLTGLGIVEECGGIGVAQRVLIGKPLGVERALFGSDGRNVGMLGRWHDVDVDSCQGQVVGVVAESHGHQAVLAKRSLGEAEASALRGPDEHVAQSGREETAAIAVGLLRCHGVEFGIVVELVLHRSTGHLLSVGIHYLDVEACRGSIVVDDVDFGVAGRAAHHLFRTVVTAEHTCMHQHAAGGRSVEPAQVEHGLRLTGTEEIPFAVDPGFHPCVVVVGVGPAGRIDLACGDAHGAQRGHSERTLLATPARGCADGGQGR